MLMILGFILLFLIMIIGGDRGVISLISLVGNMLLLSLAIWLMAAGAPVLLVTVGVGIIISCVTLFYQNGTNEKTKSAFTAVLITMAVLFFFIYMATVQYAKTRPVFEQYKATKYSRKFLAEHEADLAYCGFINTLLTSTIRRPSANAAKIT